MLCARGQREQEEGRVLQVFRKFHFQRLLIRSSNPTHVPRITVSTQSVSPNSYIFLHKRSASGLIVPRRLRALKQGRTRAIVAARQLEHQFVAKLKPVLGVALAIR